MRSKRERRAAPRKLAFAFVVARWFSLNKIERIPGTNLSLWTCVSRGTFETRESTPWVFRFFSATLATRGKLLSVWAPCFLERVKPSLSPAATHRVRAPFPGFFSVFCEKGRIAEEERQREQFVERKRRMAPVNASSTGYYPFPVEFSSAERSPVCPPSSGRAPRFASRLVDHTVRILVTSRLGA